MTTKTTIGQSLDLVNENSQYDNCAKSVLANKIILAHLLKETVSELEEFSIQEIVKFIEGEPNINLDASYVDTSLGKIVGMATEDDVIGEGKITYDIRFFVRYPNMGKELIKIIVNVEAQGGYSTNYDIETRSIFYCSRMLSAQKDTEFSHMDYQHIKKVFSIWLCFNQTGEKANSIVSYNIQPNVLLGDFVPTHQNAYYDLFQTTIKKQM